MPKVEHAFAPSSLTLPLDQVVLLASSGFGDSGMSP